MPYWKLRWQDETGGKQRGHKSAVVVEFKHVKKDPPGGLMEEALSGLRQIDEKAYVHGLRREGYERIFKYGIAFHKKQCEVAMESDSI